MTDADKQAIDDVKQYLFSSDLADDCKDNLLGLVKNAANLANGHPDKIQGITELLLSMVLQDVRNSIRQPKKIAAEVAAQMTVHVAKCPVAGGGALPAKIAWMYPFRWQIAVLACVALFSPHTPELFSLISRLMDK